MIGCSGCSKAKDAEIPPDLPSDLPLLGLTVKYFGIPLLLLILSVFVADTAGLTTVLSGTLVFGSVLTYGLCMLVSSRPNKLGQV